MQAGCCLWAPSSSRCCSVRSALRAFISSAAPGLSRVQSPNRARAPCVTHAGFLSYGLTMSGKTSSPQQHISTREVAVLFAVLGGFVSWILIHLLAGVIVATRGAAEPRGVNAAHVWSHVPCFTGRLLRWGDAQVVARACACACVCLHAHVPSPSCRLVPPRYRSWTRCGSAMHWMSRNASSPGRMCRRCVYHTSPAPNQAGRPRLQRWHMAKIDHAHVLHVRLSPGSALTLSLL